jgi:hypothetical protein
MAEGTLMHSFKELVDLMGEQELWVELRTGVRICLVDVDDYKTKVFTGKYTPCVPKSRSFPISYEKIKCIHRR